MLRLLANRGGARRVRRRCRDLLRDEVSQTVVGEDEIEDELLRLRAALASTR